MRPLLATVVPDEPRAVIAARDRSYSEQKVIGSCRLLEQRGRKPASAPWSFAAQRISEIEAFLRACFGAAGVDTDDAAMLFLIVANHIVMHERAIATRVPDRPPIAEVCRAWARRWTPGASTDEVEHAITLAVEKPRRYSAARLGELLGLRAEERSRLGIRTIRPCDQSAKDFTSTRDHAKRLLDRDRAAAKRASTGGMTREEYVAGSDAALARRLGVNRCTISRHKRAGTLAAFVAGREMQQVRRAYKNPTSNMSDGPVAQPARRHVATPVPKSVACDLARIGAQARAVAARMQHAAASLRMPALQLHTALSAANHGGSDAE